jgi:hypothetical protein
MELTNTNRGFAFGEFTDRYDSKCSIQKSSLAFEDCIWLGIEDPNPQIMVTDAVRLGLDTQGKSNGWMPYSIPEKVRINTRMHLTRDMVKKSCYRYFINLLILVN